MFNMKLQSESVPEKRQSWTVWESEKKDKFASDEHRGTSEIGLDSWRKKNHDFEIHIDRAEEVRNSPEPSKYLPDTNVGYALDNQDSIIEATAVSNMSRETKSEEFKSLIANGGGSPEETLKRMKMRPERIASASLPNQREMNTHIFDDPEPTTLSRLTSVREVLRIILNIGLLLGEGCAWVTMYTQMDVTNQDYVFIFLILPTVVASSAWLACNWCNKQLSWSYFATIFCLLLLSVPSPIFLHLFYLYEVTKCVGRSRPLGNLIALAQLCHAFTGSLPLIMSGLYMLLQTVIREDKSVAINHITHLLERYPMFTPAMFLSFCLVVTAFHRFNERRTSTLLSILVTIPFIIITVLVRILGVAVILAFHPSKWSLLILAGLSLSLLLLNLACQSNLIKSSPRKDEDEGMAECCASSNCTFLLFKLPRLLLKAIGNIFIPLGYNSDHQLGQAPIRGSLQILGNYALTMSCLSVGLGTAILYHIPNTYHGLEMTKMGMLVEIPETNVVLKTGSGMDIQVKMPATNVDLANSANLEASITMDDTMDLMVAIAVPMILVLVSLPVTITRVAMIGLNCIVVRDEVMENESGQQSLKQEIQHARKGVSWRLGLSICCGVSGAIVTSVVMLIGTSILAVKLVT